MIQIRRFKPSDNERVMNIRLADGQAQYAETAEAFISDNTDTTHSHIIEFNNEIIGFFKLDTVYSTNHDFSPKTGIGLRKFVIDSKMQGQGIGTKAVRELLNYLNQHYTDYSEIVLTVNCKNKGARACYLKAGFVDSDALYLGGEAGPQHIMSARISASCA